jgi:rSAM/selenodomain-associated transferase 2
MISIIVPTYNEEKNAGRLLAVLSSLDGEREVIFVDGGSHDRTRETLQNSLPQGARVLEARRGRAAQCNAASLEARGDIMLFLHADSLVEPDALGRIEGAVEKGAEWGCLKLCFDDAHPLMVLCAFLSNRRARRRGIVFGDQGIFIRSELFRREGGFPEMPLMEDYAFSLRLAGRGIFPVQVESPIVTSARRFREGGRLRTMFRMWRLRRLYRNGLDIESIATRYLDVR